MTIGDMNFMKNLYDQMSHMVEDYDADDEEVSELYRINRTSSPNVSLQEVNPFYHPTIYLFKTNRESQQAQYEIFPEEYNPIKIRLPEPIAGPSGILTDLDEETTW